jgi:SmpA / OmlA family
VIGLGKLLQRNDTHAMNTYRPKSWIPLIAAMVCAGCVGSDFQWDQARQIRLGMSEEQVSEVMGPPTDVRTQTYGVAWTWAYNNPREGSARVVSVVFRDGRVVNGPGIPESFR